MLKALELLRLDVRADFLRFLLDKLEAKVFRWPVDWLLAA